MTNKEFEVRWQLEVRVTRAIILHKRKQANKHSGPGQGHYQSGFPPNPKTNTDIYGSLHGIGRPIANSHHSTVWTFAIVLQQQKSTASVLLLVLPLSSCTIVTQPVLKREMSRQSSFGASVFVDTYIGWIDKYWIAITVIEFKIQITLLIVRRGALSKMSKMAKQFWCLCLCALSPTTGSQSSIYGATDHYLKNRWRVIQMDLPATFVAQCFWIWIKKTKC